MSKPEMSWSQTSGMPSSLHARENALIFAMPPRYRMPAGRWRPGMLGIADEALAVDHEAGVEAADATDAADHLLADLGHDLPEQRLIDEAREHLVRVVRLAVIRGDQRARARPGAKRGSIGAEVAAVEVARRSTAGARRRGAGRRAASSSSGTRTSAQPRLVDVDLGAADVERRDLLALGAFDQRGAGDHHVRLLGHVDAVGDDRHVAAARDAVAEHARDLRHAVRRQQRVHLEDVAGAASRPGSDLLCSGRNRPEQSTR